MRGKVAPALSENIQFGDPLNGRGRVSRSSVPAAIGSVKFYPPKVWPAMFWMSVVPAPRFPRTKNARRHLGNRPLLRFPDLGQGPEDSVWSVYTDPVPQRE